LDYTAVKITAKTREGKEIFANPMLLLRHCNKITY
jgi:hypothetical protein